MTARHSVIGCSVIGCPAAVPEGAVLCRHHWNRVTPATSAALLSAWRALRRRPGELPRSPAAIMAAVSDYSETLARATAEAALGGSRTRPEERP